MIEILIIGITLFAHLILPILFLFWIYKSKAPSKLQWLSIVAIVGSYLLLMWQGGAAWSWFGHYWPTIFLILFVIVMIATWPKRRLLPWLPEKKFRPWIRFITLASLAVFLFMGVPSTFSARSYPKEKAVHLEFPLKGGVFHIGHGGSNPTMNHHFPVNAQRFALDIVALNGMGIRAKGLMPSELERYAAFGAEVIAPCTGEVISAESTLPDQAPPTADKENILGNHIILFCQDTSVLLSHLKQNSLLVKEGDAVEQGVASAQVGNTGNTSEPHLHIHAVSGRHHNLTVIAGTAESIPMVFDDRFLIRNDRVEKR